MHKIIHQQKQNACAKLWSGIVPILKFPLSLNVAKWNLGNVNLKTMLVSGHSLWHGSGRPFSAQQVDLVHLLACLLAFQVINNCLPIFMELFSSCNDLLAVVLNAIKVTLASEQATVSIPITGPANFSPMQTSIQEGTPSQDQEACTEEFLASGTGFPSSLSSTLIFTR